MSNIFKDYNLFPYTFNGTNEDDTYTFTFDDKQRGETIDGGDGIDTLIVDYIAIIGTLEVNLKEGYIILEEDGVRTPILNFENLDLRQHLFLGANITGNNSNNLLIGTKQNDELILSMF